MDVGKELFGVIRDHRWLRAGYQRKRLAAAGCTVIRELDGKKDAMDQAALIRMARPERVLVFCHAFFLADPNTRGARGTIKSNFDKTLAAIGKRGGIIKDLETGLTTEDPAHRRAIIALSHNHIGRSNKGLRSALNGSKSPGRPKTWTDAEKEIVWQEWHSRAHKTNAEAAAAVSERIDRRVSAFALWRVVRELRRAKGMPDATKPIRPPGSPLVRTPMGTEGRPIVYFLGCNGKVKIGTTTDLPRRHNDLSMGNPDLTLLATILGGHREERELHERFREYRVRGEWFRLEGKLAEYVASLPKPRKR